MQVASFILDDIMMDTYTRGLSVEEYFRIFSNFKGNEIQLSKEEFGRAIASLGIDWGSNMGKVSEIFDAIDIATNQGQAKRIISPSDLAHAILYNGGHNVEDILAVHIMAIHKALKANNMLGKLRELFNFINSRRDNTCSPQEFKAMLLDKLELAKQGVLKDLPAEMLVQRYKQEAVGEEARVNFAMFIKDMEFAESGISPALVWAVELATNVVKSLILFGYQSPEQLFSKYIRMQGIILFEEFRRAFDELTLMDSHSEGDLRDFFAHVASSSGPSPGQSASFTKVPTVQLVNTIKKLCPKTPGMIYQDIFQALWAETKRNNMSINTVRGAFSEEDLEKKGHVTIEAFIKALQEKLKLRSLKMLDIKVLSKRYKKINGQEEVIEHAKFIADYEKFEQLGLRAGHDPLRPQGASARGALTMQQRGANTLTPE
jgi:hypothetical protein